ncbi:Hypothetical_protein [Hexamita inflata]|uniref:Hypothetical_protein n=1 Tax=Hexamita inflata TaxID=28002 RepID=A0ABP1HVV8_9EUKA
MNESMSIMRQSIHRSQINMGISILQQNETDQLELQLFKQYFQKDCNIQQLASQLLEFNWNNAALRDQLQLCRKFGFVLQEERTLDSLVLNYFYKKPEPITSITMSVSERQLLFADDWNTLINQCLAPSITYSLRFNPTYKILIMLLKRDLRFIPLIKTQIQLFNGLKTDLNSSQSLNLNRILEKQPKLEPLFQPKKLLKKYFKVFERDNDQLVLFKLLLAFQNTDSSDRVVLPQLLTNIKKCNDFIEITQCLEKIAKKQSALDYLRVKEMIPGALHRFYNSTEIIECETSKIYIKQTELKNLFGCVSSIVENNFEMNVKTETHIKPSFKLLILMLNVNTQKRQIADELQTLISKQTTKIQKPLPVYDPRTHCQILQTQCQKRRNLSSSNSASCLLRISITTRNQKTQQCCTSEQPRK